MKSETRLMKYFIGSLEIDVDPDMAWQDVLDEGSREQVASVADSYHFAIQLQVIELPLAMKKQFWQHYAKPDAEDARTRAYLGLAHRNHLEEFKLVQDAISYQRRTGEGFYREDQKRFLEGGWQIGYKFSELIAVGDAPALRRIANIIEAGGIPEGRRGGIASEDGYMLENFVKLHLASRCLPTKKQLRAACGLNAIEDKKLADKRMRKLGLWGLPTELEI